MVTEAISTGYYERWGKKYPKIQILTIEELLKGKEIEYPQSPINITFKKAEKVEATPEIQTELSL
jgi:site-specific DNA-methyltransferase (adenine-specific)